MKWEPLYWYTTSIRWQCSQKQLDSQCTFSELVKKISVQEMVLNLIKNSVNELANPQNTTPFKCGARLSGLCVTTLFCDNNFPGGIEGVTAKSLIAGCI